MFKNILSTTIVKVFNAFVAFALLLVAARVLGPESLGTIGLILLGINVILLLNNLVGGSALVFLVPRYSLKKLTSISYLWVAGASILGISVFQILKVEPIEYHIHIFVLSLIFGFNYVNQNILVGKGLIRYFNLISFIQYMLQLLLILFFFFVLKKASIESYLAALYISWALHLVLGTSKVLSLLPHHPIQKTAGLFKDVLKYGVFIQVANLTQFFSYRLTYYFVESYLGRAKLGVFEIANKFADGIWIFGKSISLVQYSWIANSGEKEDSVALTLRLFKFSFVLSFLIVLVMISLPESIYLLLFGAKYAGIHKVMLYLAPGIVFMASSMIISHYFAGKGQYHINTIISVLSLGVVALSSWILIPRFNLAGASLAATITYTISLVVTLTVFMISTKTHITKLLPSVEDLKFLKSLVQTSVGKFKSKRTSF